VRWWALVPSSLLVVGASLVALAALQGGAELAIVVIVPVIVGRSLEFVAGVLLLVAGIFTLPLAFEPDEADDAPTTPRAAPPASGGAGGLVLVGPVPIFFGTWKGASSRAWILAAVAGAVLFVAAVVLFGVLRI
jgi:uncharacterized membrane protein